MLHPCRLAIAAVATGLIAAASPARADIILNQLPTSVTSNDAAFFSQFPGSSLATFASGVVDDFTLTAATTLTSVSAALLGFGGFTSYSAVTSYSVEIYSSATAAATSLTGDVASVSVAPSGVSLTTPYGVALSALLEIPVSVDLSAGTYFVSVIASLDFGGNGAEVGPVVTGTGNAFQVNPGGGFTLPNNVEGLGANAAYELIGTPDGTPIPEPASLGLLAFGLAGLWLQRRSASVRN